MVVHPSLVSVVLVVVKKNVTLPPLPGFPSPLPRMRKDEQKTGGCVTTSLGE